MTIAANLIRDLETEGARTRTMLEAVPEDRFDWKPHDKSFSLGGLAGHLAENPSWVPSVLEGDMDFAAMKDYQPFVPKTRKEALDTLAKNLSDCLAALKDRDDATMQKTWTMRNGEQVLMSAPRADVVADIGVRHWVHHRGQMSVYLRLLGVEVPPTYGPTADRPSFG